MEVSGAVPSMARLPLPRAKSLALVDAFTVKVVVPSGVAPVVEIVIVQVFDESLEVNDTGFGENEAVAPAGSDEVTDIVAVNVPGPVPRFTVTTYVAVAPGAMVAGDWTPTTALPTFGLSLNFVSAWRSSEPCAMSLRTAPIESSGLTYHEEE